MSKPSAVTTEIFEKKNPSVKLDQAIAREIGSIAAKQNVRPETLVNEILQQYILRHYSGEEQRGSEFLLSLAGMFDTEANAVSENVETIVTNFISSKNEESVS
ncbi:MAG: hypothetical protein GXP42_19400 [Chloroflexi bacterium]|nr:hypothetical protein [Chloroflexota bacterium]